MKRRCILAVETSCDDTSVSVICGGVILSNVTLSSMNAHKHYGGIVPEIAARSHEAGIAKCYVKALKQAHIKNNQITHIAYTASPGLPGSLHIGKIFAKSIASLLNVPLIPLNHMDGHIFSFAINNAKEVEYPFISLVASGGHTVIYLVEAINKIRVLNETVDDPIGETLDKVGRILNLSYPGGISIDKIYDSKKTNTKMIHHFVPGKSFSFSGIKTHILNLVNQAKMKKQKINKIAIASSLLKWIVDEVMIKLEYYLKKYPKVKFVSIGGGVSANKLLRQSLKTLPTKILLPEFQYTGDNAAMMAFYADLLIK